MAEWFEALKSSSNARRLESDRHSPSANRRESPSDNRRADPEPEPEMLDLKRLEARQEESRQALEELQQQLVSMQRHEGQDDPNLRHVVLAGAGRAHLLELDESRKSDVEVCSPSDRSSMEPLVLKELRTQLDIVSAEAARCTTCQNSYGSELADMCHVLKNMDRKVSELSQRCNIR